MTGQDVWKQSYPARSLVVHSEEPDLTGVVEPDGKVHVVDLRTRKEVMTGTMENPSETLRNVQVIHLLADRQKFYFACQGAMEVNNVNRFGVGLASNVMTQLGMRTVPVNGRLYAFERASGDVGWHTLVKNQFLVLDQFADLPVVLLTARHQELRQGVGQKWVFVASAMSIEKRTGRVLVDDDNLNLPNNSTNFFGVSIDARSGTIDFLSPRLKITHYAEPPKSGKAVGPVETPTSKGGRRRRRRRRRKPIATRWIAPGYGRSPIRCRRGETRFGERGRVSAPSASKRSGR